MKLVLDPGIGSSLYNRREVLDMSVNKQLLNSGQLAKLTGVSTDTLRHYERKGVLARPARSKNGYRQYPPAALQRVRLIRRALSVGFTLDELANILRVRDSGGAPCQEVRTLAASKLSNIETQLRELTALRDELRSTLRDWDSRLKRNDSGVRAHLLESLVENDLDGTKPSRQFRSPLKPRTKKEQHSK